MKKTAKSRKFGDIISSLLLGSEDEDQLTPDLSDIPTDALLAELQRRLKS